MRYVILRDDDTNALTPLACLEQLYRPFLDRGLPVNLATIPSVSTSASRTDGTPEGFLVAANGEAREHVPLSAHRELVTYLKQNPGYHIVQHGLHHDLLEFDQPCAPDLARRLDEGSLLLQQAGFPKPETFVAPYDRLSKESFRAVSSRFKVLSTGWFELRRLPVAWWPRYALKKLKRAAHWSVGRTLLLSHPGCILSCYRPFDNALAEIRTQISCHRLIVLVTHWWEYFPGGRPNEKFISVLHELAAYLAQTPDLKVIKFSDLLTPLSLNSRR